jgi:hypothetical protein
MQNSCTARMSFVLGAILVTACSNLSGSATDPRFTVIKSRAGAVVVWNEASSHFTLELPGTHLVPEPRLPQASLVIDGLPVQVFTVRVDHLSEVTSCGSDVLLCYRDWEASHRRSLLDAQLAVRDLMPAAPDFISWEIDMPAEVQGRAISATKQVYATRIVGEVVLVLSATQSKREPVGSAEKYLSTVASSFRAYSEPIDVETVRRKLATQ